MKKQDYVFTTPLARSIAARKGIDISQVKGSGYNGRVLVRDLEDSSKLAMGYAKPNIKKGKTVRIKPNPMRLAIAKAMKNSWNNVAYTNLIFEVDFSTLWQERKQLTVPAVVEKLGTKMTFLPFVVRALAMALSDFPQFNANYDDAAGEIIQFAEKNIGIAVDTPHGLFVPVIKDAETKNMVEINKEVQDLAIKARNKKLSMDEMKGGTFTITNFGSIGALHGIPVINYPEIAIIGLGAIIDKVKPTPYGFTSSKVMNITLAADHRWVDGADIGRLGLRIKQILENPILMLGEFNV